MTIDEARQLVQTRRWEQKGTHCPVCDQFAKVYKRALNGWMAYALLSLYRRHRTNPGVEWCHLADHLISLAALKKNRSSVAGGDAMKLRLWGLIEAMPGLRDDGSKRVGYYKITDLGCRFVENKASVPKYVYLYNQEPLGFSDDQATTIGSALGARFNYDELMGHTRLPLPPLLRHR